ncbi:EAL domain-containing protein [Pseudobacillus sp. 179-B 2D1 NHS]|uniref:sensor domain-containing protein n=1 Tax=Pseudobacillus sp. 179-B 2D1 NHS TaxID=3374292 RepID=UPI003879317E
MKKWLSKLTTTGHPRLSLEETSSESLASMESNIYQMLFNQHPDGIVLLDSDGRVVDCNEKTAELLNYNLADLRDDFFRYVDEQHSKRVLRSFKKALKGETTQYTAIRMTKNNTPFHIQVMFTPFIVENTMQGVVGFFRDNNEAANLKDHLTRAQKIAAVGSWDYNPQEDKLFWSDQVYTILGVEDRPSFIPTVSKFCKAIHIDDQDKFDELLSGALQDGIGYEVEVRIIKMGGEVRTCFVKADVFVDDKGKVNYLTGVIWDVTEKKKKEQTIWEQQMQTKNILQAIDAAVWSEDVTHNKLLFCSNAVQNIYGVSPEQFSEDIDYWKKAIHPEDRKMVEEAQVKLAAGQKSNLEYRIIHSSGEIKWIEDRSIPTIDEKGQLIRLEGIISEISQRKEYEENLKNIANQDFLTDLPNRRKFENELSAALERATKNKQMLSLFFLDLDRFKNINDALGHAIGDRLLIEVSQRLSAICEKQGYLARLGGDEFGIFIENITGVDASLALAHKILDIFDEPFLIDDYELYVTTSIGITYAPFDGENILTLLKNADVAMYRAKEAGRNDYYVYTPTMNIETFKQYSLEKGLRNALKNNEFYLEYQPKVDSQTGRLSGAEALIRWKHPEWGIVSPGEFIPLAEESGYILTIGDWVIKQVCSQIKEWEKKGLKIVPISVNVSYKRLMKVDFVDSAIKAVKDAGIHPSYIEFEITERTMIQHEEVVKAAIANLQAYGFTFSLDDFGTCQSSLSYLSTFEIDVLKMDRSFVKEIGKNRRIESIVSSVVALSDELGIKVVAEGVETEWQFDFLRKRNCHFIQGFLFSPPVKNEVFEQMLADPYIGMNKQAKAENRLASHRKRVNFSNPMIAAMSITKIRDREVKMGYSGILITNIGGDGLSFLSQINLPERQDIILKITFALGATTFELFGIIAQKQEETEVYRYEMKFQMQGEEQERLRSLIMCINEEMKNDKTFTGIRTFSGSVQEFFEGDKVS